MIGIITDIYVYQTIMFDTLNLYNVTYQLCVSQERKNFNKKKTHSVSGLLFLKMRTLRRVPW